MLLAEDKRKLENYVNKLIDGLKKDTVRAQSDGLTGKQLIEKVTGMTVRKLTPESKMLLSSVYNMMMEHTLSENYFSDSANKAVFYSKDILKDLTDKFDFKVPSEINYEKSNSEFQKMIASGAVVVIGGSGIGYVVKITIKDIIPVVATVGIAAIIGGIMVLLLNKIWSSSSNNVNVIINEYYATVKKSIMSWINSIEAYYDKVVAEIKERG